MRTQYTKEQILFSSAARTTHPAAPTEVQTSGHTFLRFDIDITAFSGTSITFTVQYYDPGKGAWISGLATSALTATGHTVLILGPNVTAAANAAAQIVLPKRMRLMPSGTITSVTYSVTATLV